MNFKTKQSSVIILVVVCMACSDTSDTAVANNDTGISDVGSGNDDVQQSDTTPDTTPPLDTASDDVAPDTSSEQLPATAVVLVDGMFGTAEGITFNGEGDLFAVADSDVWRINRDGTVDLVVDLEAPVGLASIGERDILVAEFGPLSFTGSGVNDDGSLLRVTPEGDVTTLAVGMGDPNFIHPRADGSFLVSDDFTDIIYTVSPEGDVAVFLQGIQSPNGMVEALDKSELYVAQTFESVEPMLTFDSRVWRVPLNADGQPGSPELLAEIDGLGANDGVALDALGRLYVAANIDGKIWRIDPSDGSQVLVAENLFGVASLAFGEGEWDPESLYVTQLIGGAIWEIPVGVSGAPHNR